jgi:hypothetical protein
MIFRQLFDSVSGTYTYLIASRPDGEALELSLNLGDGRGQAAAA